MLRQRVYYSLKPFLPRRLRMGFRRSYARWLRARVAGEWPICESAGRTPEGWPGWPGGKRFAVVLTHDVEGQLGLDRCLQLSELEGDLGFRSSFNFVPEGEYQIPLSLRETLAKRGFEVGVHDLKHDGKLYRSHAEFQANARQINRYVQEWGAVGFRSGFMLHNLEWLKDLNVDYDASTFDTDPFEPQPDGVHTIFPFWVSAGEGRGYVELPYTLAQDSSLFLVLNEPTVNVWQRKLDWIVEQGGMVLLNTHPDYMAFHSEKGSTSEYPVRLYADFLRHIALKYPNDCWFALPREVAKFVRESEQARAKQPAGRGVSVRALWPAQESVGHWQPPASSGLPVGPHGSSPAAPQAAPSPAPNHLRGKRAAVVMFSPYPYDPRPRRATEAFAREGMLIDVICLRQKDEEPARETINGVNIFRVPVRRRRGGKLSYAFEYGSFIATAFFVLTFRSLSRRYRLVHVHNMPDVLVISALIPKLLGARVILDLHDPMPELMMTIFNLRHESRSVRLLEKIEKWSIALADKVVTVNLACKKIFAERSCPLAKIEVVMNSPDENIFGFQAGSPARLGPRDPARPFVVMCHGSIVERHGLDVAVDAIERLKASIPGIELRIYGQTTPFLERVMATVRARKLEHFIHYLGGRNLEQIVKAIDECDLGIIPNRRSIFTELNTPTRIFEYLARGVPVVAPRASGIQDYFAETEILFFELGDVADLAAKIEYAYRNPAEVGEFVRRGQDVYRSHQWCEERARLLKFTNQLLAPRG